MSTTSTFTVTRTNMQNSNNNKFQNFSDYKKAHDYYLELCNELNCLDNAEQSTGAEMELSAGGRGYDWRIELTIETE